MTWFARAVASSTTMSLLADTWLACPDHSELDDVKVKRSEEDNVRRRDPADSSCGNARVSSPPLPLPLVTGNESDGSLGDGSGDEPPSCVWTR
jgi:hypothetical protein